MIEIIYKDDSEKNNTDTVIKLPKNIRQIGEGGLDNQIYIEDNIVNYLNKIPQNENDIRYGVLLGNVKKGYGYTYIFINGAIDVEEIIENTVIFTDEIWTSINDNIRRYFNNLKVVGWFTSLNYTYNNDMPYINKIHLDNFAGIDKVYMRIDRVEKEENFYVYGGGGLKRQPGYHIYYDKNYNMEDYIYGSNISRNFDENKKNNENTETYLKRHISQETNSKKENYSKQGKYGIEENLHDKKVINANGVFKTLSKNVASVAMILMLAGTVTLVTNENAMDRVRAKISRMMDNGSNQNGHDIPVVGIVNEQETTSEQNVNSNSESTSNHNENNSEVETTNKEEKETNITNKEEIEKETNTTNKEEIEKETETTNKVISEKETETKTTSKVKSDNEAETTKKNEVSVEVETPSASVSADVVKYYTVKGGDTLYKIAKRLYNDETVVNDIMRLNNISDGDYIKEGDKLIVP